MAPKQSKLAKALRHAMREALKETPTLESLGKRIGSNKGTLSRFLAGADTQTVTAEQWAKALGLKITLSPERNDDS